MSQIQLTIIDRSYTFEVSGEQDGKVLKSAAEQINRRAEAIRASDRSLTPERLAVTAALQIAFDALTGHLGAVPEDIATITRVATMRMKCEEALDPPL